MQVAGAILLSLTLLTEVSSIVQAQACSSRCGASVYWGQCQSDGRCLCWWGWTGPNAQYIVSGQNHHRILADYCETACTYSHAYYNPSCASMPASQYYLVASASKLQRFDMKTGASQDLGGIDKGVVAIDFDAATQQVFYCNNITNEINSRGIQPRGAVVTVHSGSNFRPQGCAVDWIKKKIYWTNSENNKLQRSNYDGSNVENVSTINRGQSLVLDPTVSSTTTKIYWVEWKSGNAPRIKTATVTERTGQKPKVSEKSVVVSVNMDWPAGLSLDYANAFLYWTDPQQGGIERYSLVTKIREKDFFSEVGMPGDLALNETNVMWIDTEGDDVRVVDIRTSNLAKKIKLNDLKSKLNAIAVYDSAQQPSVGVNECNNRNGGCSGTCKDTPASYACLCPNGTKLQNDSLTCEGDQACSNGTYCSQCPCLNGGNCTSSGTCVCRVGFSGSLCENAVLTTAVSSTTTVAPATTKPSLTTTSASLATTEVPSTTTEAPQTTTKVPVVTTKAPPTTTGAPQTRTEVPVVTAKAPQTTTESPQTTEVPVVTAKAPQTTTGASQTTTAAPVTTKGVLLTTAGAQATTRAPFTTTAEVPQTTTGEALLPSAGPRSEAPETRAAPRPTEEQPRCPTEYCQNGGTCTVQLGSPTCECMVDRFQGEQCQEKVPLPIPCREPGQSECAEENAGGFDAQLNDQSGSSSNVYIGVGVALPLAIVAIVVAVLFKRRKSRKLDLAHDNEVALHNSFYGSAGLSTGGKCVDHDNPTYGVVLAPKKSNDCDSGVDISNPEYGEIVLNNCTESSSRATSFCPTDVTKSFRDPPGKGKGKEKGTDTEDDDYADPTTMPAMMASLRKANDNSDRCGLSRDEASKGEVEDTEDDDYADPTTVTSIMESPKKLAERCGTAQEENLNEAKEAASLRQDAELYEIPQNVSTAENESDLYEQPVSII